MRPEPWTRARFPRLRHGRLGLILVAALGSAALLPVTPALAERPAGVEFGLAHVDVMELHLERQPEGPAIRRERLTPDEIERRYRLAKETGAGWHRWSIYRELVEQAGEADWSVVDAIADRDARAGLSTLALLQGSPEGMHAAIFLDAAGLPTDDPKQAERINPDNGWAEFVDAVALRYRPGGTLARERGWPELGGARAWEIGNEPNLAQFWAGTAADYARYLEVAYLVIHRRDPEAIVLHGGIGDDGNAEAWYGDFLEALKARAASSDLPARYGFYFDRAAWHWYRTPSLLMTGPARARGLLTQAGLPEKAVWVTETGLPVWSEYPGPCWDPGSPGRASVVEQADFVWQTLAEAAASGVEVVILFQLFDDCGNGPTSYDAFGLIRNPLDHACWQVPSDRACWRPDPATAGQPRPSYAAFQIAVEALSGSSLRRQSAAGGMAWRELVFDRQPDSRVTLAWATQSRPVEVQLEASALEAELHAIEVDGRISKRRLGAEGGRYRVELPGAANRNSIGGRGILDGRPILLIERGLALTAGAAGIRGAGADLDPPLLAVVEPLPEVSPREFFLGITAADPGSGLAAFVLYVASGSHPPRSAAAWSAYGGIGAWNADPAAGRVRVPFEGQPGQRYYFAAQAVDRAGNWSALPAYAQATSRIVSLGGRGFGGRALGHTPH